MTVCSKYFRVLIYLDIDSNEIQNLKRNANLEDAIVAVNGAGMVLSLTKAAKQLGITRPSTINTERMKYKYPFLEILRVPDDKWGKPESKSKRIASFKIMNIVQEFARRNGGFTIQMNSLDDMYLDVTDLAAKSVDKRIYDQDNYIVPRLWKYMRMETGFETVARDGIKAYLDSVVTNKNTHLIMGAVIAQELVHEILLKTGFKVSCGIGRNRITAKIATTLYRPRGITILTSAGFTRVSEYVLASKITGMGGDRGTAFLKQYGEDLTIAELGKMDEEFLEASLGCLAHTVLPYSWGLDCEPLVHKTMSKSMSCGKSLDDFDNDTQYLKEEITKLCEELKERNFAEELVFHNRIAIRFRMDVGSWYRYHPKYSCGFNFTPDGFKCVDPGKMAEIIVQGLRHNGFQFGKFYAKKLNLSVLQFAEPPAHWRTTGT